ncbi:MAG: VWA domain-containing protein [Deltaproteobacteria bacterium]|nr:VWA domain-containing protein [Deltaproteobacteria bacterium]
MRFASPFAFLALLLIPVLLFFRLRKGHPRTLKFSAIELLRPAGISWRQHLLSLPLILRILALILLVTAFARPQQGIEKVHDISHGIAIEMVIDRSSSMGQEMVMGNLRANRLEVVKKVFAEFVSGNGNQLAGRPNDLIGLVSFARYPETVCPLTLAHEAVSGFMANIQLVSNRDEDGTSIGDGIALAAARLQKADEAVARENRDDDEANGDGTAKQYEIKSKIIIVLTDGVHNAGDLTPLEAAQLAAQWGIKIYTIGIGEDTEAEGARGFFALLTQAGRGVDKKTLQEIAQTSGGIFRMASDADSLRSIYEEIDRLEKSEIESVRHIDYAEHFPLFVMTALALLMAEMLLGTTLLRKIP